jgi:putative transposase
MQKLLTGYTMYFNKKYERSGALFQGKFKATHAEDDNYLKYLISYMHLNPVKLIEPNWKTFGIQNKGAAKKFLSGYRFSSYSDFRGVERIEKNILNCAALPDYFSTTRDFDNEVSDWLEFTEFQDS